MPTSGSAFDTICLSLQVNFALQNVSGDECERGGESGKNNVI